MEKELKRRRRIAVLIGQAEEGYQSRFISGFLTKAFSYDMDACIFSMYRKYQDNEDRERGESNIFALFNPAIFDAVVFVKDTIQTSGVAKAIEERLHRTFTGPVIVVERESDYFPTVITDSYASAAAVVRHLIEVHGYMDIAFLTGKRWHPHSEQRLKAYRDEMERHGININEDWIIYGDFWYSSGEQCAEYLMQGPKLPQAVMCANDQMALGLCKAFEKKGVRVPEDIAVCGYDSTEEGQTAPRSLTSAMIPADDCGAYSADFIHAKLEGKEPPKFVTRTRVLIGESCGCRHTSMPEYTKKRKDWETDTSEVGWGSINNMLPDDILSQTSLLDMVNTVYSYAYQIPNVENFYLCINDRWKYMATDMTLTVGNDGYSDRMIYAVRYHRNMRGGLASLDTLFDTKDILPALYEKRSYPTAFFFTPVFAESQCFGYAALNFGPKPISYSDVYRLWIGTISRGLECVRRYSVAERVVEQLRKLKHSKFATATEVYSQLPQEEKEDYDLVTKILDENLLEYYFQPIVQASDGEIYSYEALMRSKTEKRISPLDIIKYANMQGRLADVERATFMNVLDIVERDKDLFGDAKVFINSIPGVKLYDSDYSRIAIKLEENSRTAVIELTEEAELDDDDLEELKKKYRRMNLEIAVDDYGTGYSNVNNLLRYMPDYVKIDRSLLSDIQNRPQKQHFVREIIEFCHDNGIKALAEGVENADEMRTVVKLGVDLIQGFYTAKPSPKVITTIPDEIKAELASFFNEKELGNTSQQYIAGKTNRIPLGTLDREGYNEIVVGVDNQVYQDITIIGTPHSQTGIRLTVKSGYNGMITLENVYFASENHEPCIDIEEGCAVSLMLVGDNFLNKSGIRVPKSSRLVLEGNGTMKIDLYSTDYYGIGNVEAEGNGDIVFEQSGKIMINAVGKRGVCVGSGLGGYVSINQGQIILSGGGETSVGIGAISGEVKLNIKDCNIESDINAVDGVFIGSIDNNAEISLATSSIKCYGGGASYVGIGSLHGGKADIMIREASVNVTLRSERSTCLGTLSGRTDVLVDHAGIILENSGKEALAIGGMTGGTFIRLENSDAKVDVHTALKTDTYAKDEDIKIVNGRIRFLVNGYEVDRRIVSESY
ncbi:MAG: EAL domain-containing protein [Lachnospiraceae bacterium]|nr:EAL domain-containing protein [Lachnospiraceae bacterium]